MPTKPLDDLHARLQAKLVDGLPPSLVHQEDRDQALRQIYQFVVEETASLPWLSASDRHRLSQELYYDIKGLGPLHPLLEDPAVTDIMVNRWDRVYVERNGLLQLTDVRFRDERHLRQVMDRIATWSGRRCDESMPILDVRMPDGSRANLVIPPIAADGAVLTIRRFSESPFTMEQLVGFGSLSPQMAALLEAAVRARTSILISGATGSGKTTLLNALCWFIARSERVVTVEEACELRLPVENWVRLEARPPGLEGTGEVDQRMLVRTALRMRPDRIIVGEARGGEALDMLIAMHTGHSGSMSTLHANGCRDALARLEVMALMADVDLPYRAVREMVSSAVGMVVHLERLEGGHRVVSEVVEVGGLVDDVVQLLPLFTYNRATRRHEWSGLTPRFFDQIRAMGKRPPELSGGDSP